MPIQDPGRTSGTIIAPLNRVDRAAGRVLRERQRQARKAERRRAGKRDAEAHEKLVARLTKAHQVAFKRIDWKAIVDEGPVAPTVARDAVSQAARRQLTAYRPTLMDNLLGLEREKRRTLTAKIQEAGKADAELYARAVAAAADHNRRLQLAPDVAALKPEAIAGVLRGTPGAEALKEAIESFSVLLQGQNRLIARIDLLEYDALPDEACTAPAAGTATYAELSPIERRELELANACSVALRVAIEVLQVAPVETVEVVARRCRPGGLTEAESDPVFYVKVPAVALTKAPLAKLEAPTVAGALGARFDWTPVRGFATIKLDDLDLGDLGPSSLAA